MIVEPDFPTHWKTQLLISLVAEETHAKPTVKPAASHGEPSGVPPQSDDTAHVEANGFPLRTQRVLAPEGAPMLVIRLWAHCQTRRTHIFPEMSNNALRAVCGWQGDALRLREILMEAGFIENDVTQIVVHQWDEVNAKLFANWRNGPKGGRPKQPKPAASEKPTDNPIPTQRKPIEKIEKIDSLRGRAGACERAEVLEKICPIFGADPLRPLSQAAEFALSQLLPIPADELRDVAAFLALPADDSVIELRTRPQKPKTLFVTWQDVVAVARGFAKKNGADFSAAEKKPARVEPDGWRARFAKKYPNAEIPASFFELPKSLQADPDISGGEKGGAAS